MPITISGSTGIAGVDGSASTPAVQGTDTNTGIFFPAADTIAFGEGGSEVMRIDSSGNVGIGTSSLLRTLHVVSNAAETQLLLRESDSSGPQLLMGADSAVSGSIINASSVSGSNSNLLLQTGGIERARIDSSGNLLVGRTSTLFASSHAFDNSGAAVLGLRNATSTAGKYWQVGPDSNSTFKVYNQSNVGMFLSDGGTSWSSSSDEHQKNIIEPISDATNKVASLRAVIGSYKSDETNKRRSFLIAQDVQQVLPEAVTEAPDGFLGVAYSDVIPLLVAAIQELKADNNAMKERIATLEAK
jgi:hypothetical protein